MRIHCLTALAVAASLRAASAQTEIDPEHKYAWGENIGWTNWRDAGDPAGSGGVRVHETFLSGFIWGENVGWINAGNGMPADGSRYGNIDGSDSGVNIDANGDLFGYAWGENIGWIQFDTRSKGDQRARLDRAARRFRGYAWGENVGWINLDDEARFVGTSAEDPGPVFLRGDTDENGIIDLADALHTLGCLFQGTACTRCIDAGESNDDQVYDLVDAIHTLNWLFIGGPAPPEPGPESCGPDPTDDPYVDCIYEGCP